MKWGLTVFSPQEVAALRIFSGTLFLMPLAISRFHEVTVSQHKWVFFSGLMGPFLPPFLVAIAQDHMGSATNGALNALATPFTQLVGWVFFAQHLSRREIWGAVFGVLGTLVLISGEVLQEEIYINYYVVLSLLACFCYGVHANLNKYRLQGLHPFTVTSVSFLFLGLLSGIGLCIGTNFITKLLTVEGAFQAIFYVFVLGVFASGFAYLLFVDLVQRTSPIFASMASFIVPIIALLGGVLDGEMLVWEHYVGVGIILFGVYLITQKGSG